MTKDSFTVSQAGGSGGAKKFLYSGPPRKTHGFEDGESSPAFNFNSPRQNQTKPGIQLNEVWGLQNITIPNKSNAAKPSNEGWDRNVGKGFYSRHGGLTDDKKTKEDHISNTNGRSWGQQKNYNYSYTTGTSNQDNTTLQNPNDNKPLMGGTRYGQTGISNTRQF